MKVYDTSAILNRFEFSLNEVAYITHDVLLEIKDFEHRNIVENKISLGFIKVLEPSLKYLDVVFRLSNKSKLSIVDKRILALCYEKKFILVSDDNELRKFAHMLGLITEGVFYEKELKFDEFENVFNRVFLDVAPNENELLEVSRVSNLIKEKLTFSISKLNMSAKVVFAGSSARNTFISGDRDLDIFILFNLDVDNSLLHEYNKKIILDAFPNLELIEDYSEHTYFKAKLFGFDLDFVPGYNISNILDKKSSVDRTPLHMDYLNRVDVYKYRRDILVFKKFLKNNLLYGADLKNEGMPGYLVELLIVHYGSFANLIKSFLNMDSLRIGDDNFKFNDSFVFVDPIDSNRNVASAFSSVNFSILKKLILEFANNPNISFFYENSYPKVEFSSLTYFSSKIKLFKTIDSAYGHYKSVLKKCVYICHEKGLIIDSSSLFFLDDRVYFVFKFSKKDFVKVGPFVHDFDNALKFKEKNPLFYEENFRLYAKTKLNYDEKIKILGESFDKFDIILRLEEKLEDIDLENKKSICKDFYI